MKLLSQMKSGEKGVITKIEGLGVSKRRLIDMGITPDVEVIVRKIAPLGDPMEITLRGFDLAIRKEDASKITVEVRS